MSTRSRFAITGLFSILLVCIGITILLFPTYLPVHASSTLALSTNSAVAYANQNWNYNSYNHLLPAQDCENANPYSNCVTRVIAPSSGRYQPDFQCAEFVARALSTEGIFPNLNPNSTPQSYQQYKVNGTPYNLLTPSGLYSYLTQRGWGKDVGDNPGQAQPGDVVFYYTPGTNKQTNNLEHTTIITISGGTNTKVDSHNVDYQNELYSVFEENDKSMPRTIVHITGLGATPTPTPTPPPSANLMVTQGVWTSSATLGGHLDAQYTVTNEGNAAFNLSQLYIAVRGPDGENVDLGGDGNNTPIQPGQSRNIYEYTNDFASGCSTCNDGTYTVLASVQLPNGSWWNPPAANGAASSTTVTGFSPILITQGTWTYNPLTYGEHFDAQYTVTNESNSPFNLDQLYIGIVGPNGQNVDLGGDGNNTPIQPGQTRNVYKYTDSFATNCNSCGAGTYTVYAEIQKSDGTWWIYPPAAPGNTNVVSITMNPANIIVTDGLYTSGNTTLGGSFNANYQVTNEGNAPFDLTALYLAVRDPNGNNADLGGDGNSTPILPGQSRRIYLATNNFGGNCPYCTTGTYSIFASILLPDGSWWSYPPTDGQHSNQTTFSVSSTTTGFTVGHNQDGSIQIFKRSSNGVIFTSWKSSSSGTLSSWISLPNPNGITITDVPTVVLNTSGEMQIFALGSDGSIETANETSASSDGSWTGWSNLQLGATFAGNPQAIQQPNGMMDVYVRGNDNQLYHAYQNADGTWNNFTVVTPGTFPGDPSVSINSSGEMQVFMSGFDTRVYSTWQTVPGNNSSWLSSWTQWTPGMFGSGSTPIVFKQPDGMLALYDRGQDNQLYQDYQDANGIWLHTKINGNWSLVTQGAIQGNPAITTNNVGETQLFVIGTNGTMYSAWETSPGNNSSWSNWTQQESSSPTFSPMIVAIQQPNNNMDVYAFGANNLIYEDYQNIPNSGSWTGWQQLPW